ncbi:MAG: hypothetical protein JST59_05810 [Actinobacteria bacterium]|nr:hypothetical protein [Actinomycetota bacterium]
MGPSYPPRRNLELKARDRAPARSLAACLALGAEDKGTLTQRDTYFGVPRGRLKLREEPGVPATLIAYERPDQSGSKESRYRLVEVREPAAMRAALESENPARFASLLDALRLALDIRDEDLVRASYSDLLLEPST